MGVLRSYSSGRIILFCCLVILLSGYTKACRAEESKKLQLQEQTIKAGLVYNFLKYTTWPDNISLSDKGKLLRICFFGGDPLDGNLSLLEGRTAQQSTINIVRIKDVKDSANCNLVFINRGSVADLPALFAFLQDKHVLTISDIDEFTKLGGMVELTTEDKRIALYINKNAVERAGLRIQDRLLKLAKMVSG